MNHQTSTKKLILVSFILIFGLIAISCKKKPSEETITKKELSIDPLTIKVGWTAYKTTDKVAVSGEFTKVNINKLEKGSSVHEVLNGIEFSIPVSSIFSNNEIRDTKLKQFFFGIMDNTELLSGTITTSSETTATVNLTMNKITSSIPVTYTTENQTIYLSGNLNLDNWDVQSAIESLNNACLDLHKGTDGISKTWNDVEINASITLKN